MTREIKYSSAEKQLEKLKSHHLKIDDETKAIKALKCYGYSNLIKSYRDLYVIQTGDHKEYRSMTSFEQILSLFQNKNRTAGRNCESCVPSSKIIPTAKTQAVDGYLVHVLRIPQFIGAWRPHLQLFALHQNQTKGNIQH